jgi:hypothetical protein
MQAVHFLEGDTTLPKGDLAETKVDYASPKPELARAQPDFAVPKVELTVTIVGLAVV